MGSLVELVLLTLVIGGIIALGRYFGGLATLDLLVEQLGEDWLKQGALVQFAPVRAAYAADFNHRQSQPGALGIADGQIVFRNKKRTITIPLTQIRDITLQDVEYRGLQGDVIRVPEVVAFYQNDPQEAVPHTFTIKTGSRPFAEQVAQLCQIELRHESTFRSL